MIFANRGLYASQALGCRGICMDAYLIFIRTDQYTENMLVYCDDLRGYVQDFL